MFHIIGGGFLLVCPLGAGVFLVVEFGFVSGFLTVFMPAVHARYAPGSGPQYGMVGQVPANRTGGTIFQAATRLGPNSSRPNRCDHNARQPQSYHAVQCHTLSLFHIPDRSGLPDPSLLSSCIWWQDYGF